MNELEERPPTNFQERHGVVDATKRSMMMRANEKVQAEVRDIRVSKEAQYRHTLL